MHFVEKEPSQKRSDLVKKLKTNKILRVPGAYNPLTAKLIEEIVTLLNHSIKTKGEATLLLSGGNTPKNLYQKLSLQNIEWDKVNVGLVDERFVDKESPLCNEKMIRDTLIQNQASKARLIGMLFEDHYERNLLRAKEQYKLFLHADVLILGYVGAMPAEGLYLLIARVATAYYFLHFLVILPVLGLKEKTLPIPLSITEPVLGGSPNIAMAKNKESLNK